jgi:hypothetical protein
MPRTRKELASIGFAAVWMTFWAAGMLVVLWAFGGAVLRGELPAILFTAVWLAAAAFALHKVARQLRERALHGKPPRRRARDRAWKDDATGRDLP